jgi:hypothetical protein
MAIKDSPEKALAYAALAREKMDSIWERRKTSWRTGFMLWTGLVATAVRLYKEAFLHKRIDP